MRQIEKELLAMVMKMGAEDETYKIIEWKNQVGKLRNKWPDE